MEKKTMFETKKLSREKIEQRRLERKPIKRANRNKRIIKQCCKQCGEPKHYICLDHHTMPTPKISELILKKLRYYSRKLYFSLARKLNFAE